MSSPRCWPRERSAARCDGCGSPPFVVVWRDDFGRYGDIYFVPGKPDGLFVLRHPDQFCQVLVEQAASFNKEHGALERLKLVLGTGLLTSDGDDWRRHRRMIQPAFQHARLVGYCDLW